MTKKTIAKTLVLAGLVAGMTPSLKANTGIYVGAAVGGSALTGTENLFVNRDITIGGVPTSFPQSYNTTIGDKNIEGEIFLGYGKRFNCIWLAIEALASFSSLNPKATFDISAPASAQPLSVKTTNAWGGTFNIGYHINQPTRLYVKLGIESRRFTPYFNATNAEGDPLMSLNKRYNSTAFVPGLGMETELCPRFLLRAEYRTALHPRKTVQVSGTSPTTTIIRTKPTIHYFNIGLTLKI